MNKKTLFGISILLLIVLIPNVLSTGVCILDKYSYHPGETPLFYCSCSLPNEENSDGFIVWRNSTGSILQNISINSGNCRVSQFGDTYTFASSFNTTGNATFETIDPAWADASDTFYDTFNVSGVGANDCILSFFGGTANDDMNLGEKAFSAIEVTDGITGDPIIHATCSVSVFSTNNTPISTITRNDLRTTVDGNMVFEHLINEPGWEIGTSFTGEFHCYCLNDSTEHAEIHHCYNSAGNNLGFKTCTLRYLTTPGGQDLRTQDSAGVGGASIALIIFLLFITGTIFFFPFLMDYLGKSFAKSDYVNIVVRRSCFLLGTYLMQLNAAMMLTIVMNSGLTMSNNITFYLWFFGMAGYLYMMYLALITIIDVLSMIADKKHKDRFGDDNE